MNNKSNTWQSRYGSGQPWTEWGDSSYALNTPLIPRQYMFWSPETSNSFRPCDNVSTNSYAMKVMAVEHRCPRVPGSFMSINSRNLNRDTRGYFGWSEEMGKWVNGWMGEWEMQKEKPLRLRVRTQGMPRGFLGIWWGREKSKLANPTIRCESVAASW